MNDPSSAEVDEQRWDEACRRADAIRDFLQLMRRIPRNISQDTCLERFRVLGAVCPEFDVVVADRQIPLPSAGKPILPIRLRPALLAAVATVECEGPKMLEVLQGHAMGTNRTRFGEFVASILGQ